MKGRVGVGVIGAGLQGELHAASYSELQNAELLAVCDINEERAKEVAERYGAERWYTDVKECLKHPGLEAVSVATPDFAHKEPVITALRAGKHVLCEKPLAISVKDAEEMVRVAGERGLILMAGFENRFSPPFVQAYNSIKSGEIGEPMMAYFRLSDTIDVPLRMIKWAGKTDPVFFLLSHVVDLIRWLFNSEVERVFARGIKRVLKARGIDVYDVLQASLRLKSGAIATLETSWILPPTLPNVFDFYCEIVGSKGCIYINPAIGGIKKFTSERYEHPDMIRFVRLPVGFTVGFVKSMCEHFIRCVLKGEKPITTGEDGLKVVKVLDSIMRSADSGREVVVEN